MEKMSYAQYFEMDKEHYCPDAPEGMHVVYADRSDSFRCTMVPNIVYANRHRPLHLQLLRPVTMIPGKKYPLIIYVQGSGFRAQEIYKPVPQMSRFVQSGYLVACMEYRHTDEGARFPAQIQDAKSAIRFLRKNAATYQIDENRIALWGDSSGGHTSAMVAVTAGKPEFDHPDDDLSVGAEIKCVVDFYGVTDMVKQSELKLPPEQLEHFNGNPTEKLFGKPLEAYRKELEAASVTTHIKPNEPLPPFLLIHGDEDEKVPFWQSVLLYEALKKVQVPVEFYKVKGGGHGHRVWTVKTMELVEQFLCAYL